MKVLVDTPIWSLALRRSPKDLGPVHSRFVEEFAELVRENRAEIIGPIRQELLSGIREGSRFRSVRDHVRAFEDSLLTTEDYEEAAQISNQCRAAGISGSPVDFLICATALRRRWQIFTLDKDFQEYARYLGIVLFVPRNRRP